MASVSPLRAFGLPRVHHPFEGKVNTRKRRRFKEQTREMPKAPGVYFFYGYKGRLLYVGKAKCLRERVRSYFADTAQPRSAKLKRLLAEIESFEWHEVGSELEALLLERRLIAERRPLLNRQLKRFEVYPYLLLSDEEFPRLTITRAEPVEGAEEKETAEVLNEINAGAGIGRPLENVPRAGDVPGLYLGPFTSPRHAYWTLEAVRNLFPLRSCDGEVVPDPNGRGCFYREIGRCCGPCIGQTSRAEYARLCRDLVNLLQSGSAPQLDALRRRMERLAEQWRFEEAGEVKLQIEAIEAVAARLLRLSRMRRENNAVIARPGIAVDGEPRFALFLVQGGIVRRHLVVGGSEQDWLMAGREVRELFAQDLIPQEFTAQEELDEMMILDRWLRAHGEEPGVVWMNERRGRQWNGNAMRQLRRACGIGVVGGPEALAA